MREQLNSYLENAITLLLLVVAFVTPLFFLDKLTEFYEMPKLSFLAISTLLLYGLWIFSWIAKGKIVITRTPLDVPLLLLLATVVISTYFSTTRYPAIYGNFPNVHGSAISWVTYILLYFVTASNLKDTSRIKYFLYAFMGSGVMVSLLSLLSFFTIFMPFDFARSVNFTPTGSSFSTVALLLMMLPLPLISIVKQNKYLPMPASIALAALFGITIVLLGSIPVYVVLLALFVLSALILKPYLVQEKMVMFLIPVVVTFLTLLLAYMPLPGNINKLQQLENNFPKEIQLPLSVSWKISASAFRDAPFIGTGPSTFLFNFTSYKPAEFNVLRFWNFSFTSAHNEFLQAFGTMGLLGLLSLTFLCVVIINMSRKVLQLQASSAEHLHDSTQELLPGLAITGVVSVVLLAIHATTLISVVSMMFMFAIFMMSQKSIRDRIMELSIGIKASTADNKQLDLFPILIFLIFLVGAVPALVRAYNIIAADYYHREALAQANRNASTTYQYLQKAESLNPYIDLYRVDMAQTNFAIANAIAAKKGPTKDNPQGSLTDQDKKTIQTLLSQAINEGKASIALSPRSARNWEVLASVYRNITGVAKNALTFSLDAYGRAIQIDPLNPALRVSVGGIYYSIKNYDMANRFFTDAINLKPDYANAYFNLAISLREKGDLANAKAVADQLVVLMQKNPNTPDYKTATALADDLKTKLANASANTEGQTGTENATGQQVAGLQNPNLPNVNVSNLNNPPQVATPAAVVKNPKVTIPQNTAKVTPVPTKAQ